MVSKSLFRFTIDVESDWGGRTDTLQGVYEGLPFILDLFSKYGIKALFFISTEHIEKLLWAGEEILKNGHSIGSHGHVHMSWRGRPWWRWRLDYMAARELIKKHFGIPFGGLHYRAPKFSYRIETDPYSKSENHISILKQAWLSFPRPEEPIIYAHPFDFVHPVTKAPNLALAALYAFPNRRRTLLEKYCEDFAQNG